MGAYSKGMRRKVVITAALLHNPPVVFFDEPLDGLDANAAVGFKALIQTLAREGKTIVYSSHILDVVERVCHRVIIIDKGKLLVDGKPDELVATHEAGTLERLFTQLTGGVELESPCGRLRQDVSAMNPDSAHSSRSIDAIQTASSAPAPQKTLHQLFLTLFLRGHSSRGLQKSTAPKSIAQKLTFILVVYALFGCLSLNFRGQPVFALAIYLHAITFVMVAMFIAASAGEILFNNQEADILLHRPVTARALLTAKVRVLVEVSLWLAVALNFIGLFVGLAAPDGGWRFPLVHLLSTALEALFCAGAVVVTYQVCLRRFGRERLEAVMTSTQVIVSIGAVLAGQLLPQLVLRFRGLVRFSADAWWLALLPPAWFASLDDALSGGGALSGWILGAIGILITAVILWLALGKLAQDYAAGLQVLGEAISPPRRARSRRRIEALINLPPFRWWLGNPTDRASFLLTTAYIVRDRETKLRLYPSLAPILVIPFVFLLHSGGPRRWARC